MEETTNDFNELFDVTNYKDFLNLLFIIHKRKNKHLSKRTFSKLIGISHSHFINTISSKKKLTLSTAIKISEKCNFDIALKTFFLDLIENGYKSTYLNNSEKATVQNSTSIYSSWYAPSILSLAGVSDINLTPEKAATLLNLPLKASRDTFNFLIKESLLTKNKNGFYEKTKNINTINKAKNADIEKFHLELLDKVKEKILSTKVTERSVSSISFTVSEKKFKSLQEKIFNFTYNLIKEAKENIAPEEIDTLYVVSTQLVPLCKIK